MIKQMQEQQHVAQEMMQEQQRAADECQRQFMATILDRRADQTPALTRSTIEKSPPIKFDFKEFSGNSRTGQHGPRSTGYRRLDVPESFNDWGGRGYDDFVPGVVIETAPSTYTTA